MGKGPGPSQHRDRRGRESGAGAGLSAGEPGGAAWVLFDGRCGLCDATVRWLLARDRRAALLFAPLDGAVAAAVRARHPGLPAAAETLVLVERPGTDGERVRVRSRAVIEAVGRLGGPWRAVLVLRALPACLLDAPYRFVARRRTRWFGRLAACRVPGPRERARFLEAPERRPPSGSIDGA
jgi:predicted DCC family thiol-disulfide oxidoreductase YuxK